MAKWLEELALSYEGAFYGYKKLTHLLRNTYKVIVNHKKVYRLCREMGLLKEPRQRKPRESRRMKHNWLPDRPNQLWAVDIKYGYVNGTQGFFCIMPVLDLFDRMIVGCYIGVSCRGENVAATIGKALVARGVMDSEAKPTLRSDNGPQFVSKKLANACQGWHVAQERIPVRSPNLNAHIESFNALLEMECLGDEFDTFLQAKTAVLDYIEFYNAVRLHSSLKYASPQVYHDRWLSAHAAA